MKETFCTKNIFLKCFIYFTSIISNLKTIYSPDFSLQKHDKFSEYLSNNNNTEICIIVPELIDANVYNHTAAMVYRKLFKYQITAITPSDYHNKDSHGYDVTVIVGWLSKYNAKDTV